MLPATEKPSWVWWPNQSTHSAPERAATFPWASIRCSWRCSRPSSAPRSRATTSSGARPSASRSSPRGPYVGLTRACVATAPTPARANGQSEPTPKNLVVTATPSMPVCGSRATMEKVMSSSLLESRIERIAEPVADQVEAQDSQEDGEAGKEREPGRLADELPSETEHGAPGGRRRLGAEAEKAQRGFGQDGVREGKRKLHDDRSGGARHDVLDQHAQLARTRGARRLHVVVR